MDLLEVLEMKGDDIRREVKILKQKGVFGIIIESEAPVVVCDCMAYIRAKGLFNVGLFRVNGNMDRIQLIKEKYTEFYDEKDSAETVNVDVLSYFEKDELSVNDVASLLKNYFMKLEEPLIPHDAYDKFCAAYSIYLQSSDEDSLIESFNTTLRDIFSPNRECLGLVISFLREVATFEDQNKMSYDNLAKIWCMSLMRGRTSQEELGRLGIATGALKALIRLNVRLYMPSVRTVQQNTKYRGAAPVPPARVNRAPPGLPSRAPQKVSDEVDDDDVDAFLNDI